MDSVRRFCAVLSQLLSRRVLTIKDRILNSKLKAMPGDFPPEILVEILHRLPLKSLVKFTSVCKAWNSLITNQSFIYDHLNRTIQASNGNCSLFFPIYHSAPRSPNQLIEYETAYALYSEKQQLGHFFVEEFPLPCGNYPTTTVIGTCDGLICYFEISSLDRSENLVIWNPLIRKYVVPPKPIVTCSYGTNRWWYLRLYGFGFDSRNKDYKIVRVVTDSDKQNIAKVDVYSLASNSWRDITIIAPPFIVTKPPWATAQVFVNGVVHWVVWHECDGQMHNCILTFDVVEEMFGVLMLPPHLSESTYSLLSVLNGGQHLSMLHFDFKENELFLRIWIMKEYGIVESWSEVFCCGPKLYGDYISNVLSLDSNGKVVLRLSNRTVVLLDPVTEVVRPLTGPKCVPAFVGSFVETLVLISKEPHVLSYR